MLLVQNFLISGLASRNFILQISYPQSFQGFTSFICKRLGTKTVWISHALGFNFCFRSDARCAIVESLSFFMHFRGLASAQSQHFGGQFAALSSSIQFAVILLHAFLQVFWSRTSSSHEKKKKCSHAFLLQVASATCARKREDGHKTTAELLLVF